MSMPDPFRSTGAPEAMTASMGGEAWDESFQDDFVAAPDVNLEREQVVELNLDDLDRGAGAYGERAPRRVGEPMELPAMADEDDGVLAVAGAIPSAVLLSIPRKVNVEMGSVTLNGRDLMKLAYGSVVQLSQTVGDPVELVLEGRTIAQGEIVLINGRNLGVRILSLRK
jgi:flagellar motor switch protein FliN